MYIISWGWDPSLNVKFIFHIHLHIYSPEVILYCILNKFVHETKFVYVQPSESKGTRCGIFHLYCHISTENVLDFRAFQVSDFLIRDAQSVFVCQR